MNKYLYIPEADEILLFSLREYYRARKTYNRAKENYLSIKASIEAGVDAKLMLKKFKKAEKYLLIKEKNYMKMRYEKNG